MERKRTTEALDELLADHEVHYQKLRNYHWNVQGAEFLRLHVELEMHCQEAQLNADPIAARVRVLDERSLSTYAEFLKHSALKEDPTVPEAKKMVQNILADEVVLLDLCSHTVDSAAELHDRGTGTMVKGFITPIQKHHRMLNSFNA